MSINEFLLLLPLIVEAAKSVKEVADLIERVEAGEKITAAEVTATMAKVRSAVANWDNTEPDSR